MGRQTHPPYAVWSRTRLSLVQELLDSGCPRLLRELHVIAGMREPGEKEIVKSESKTLAHKNNYSLSISNS
jgi:hypothetical protein